MGDWSRARPGSSPSRWPSSPAPPPPSCSWRAADASSPLALPAGVQAGLASWLGLPVAARRLVVDPLLALSRALAAFDDRVVDAGVRAAAQVPVALSRAASWWGERSLDGVVRAVSGGALRAAVISRQADERGVDRAVEDLARGAGAAGRTSRRLQTGLAHQYYVIVVVGFVATVAAAVLGR